MPTLTSKLAQNLQERRLLNGDEVQRFLNISKTALYMLMRNKKNTIPSVKIGGRRRFQFDKLLYWIENQSN